MAGSATDPDDGDTVSYAKTSGPAWLNVASDGTLSGSPAEADIGSNSWVIVAFDGNGGTNQASLVLSVQPLSIIPEPELVALIDEHFTAAEGYTDGSLNGPWSGNLTSFTVNSSGTGSLLPSATHSWRSVTHSTSLGIAGSYTVGMEFSFNRATNDITDGNNTFFGVGLSGRTTGSGFIGFGLMRRNGVGVGNQYRLKSNGSAGSPTQYANSGYF